MTIAVAALFCPCFGPCLSWVPDLLNSALYCVFAAAESAALGGNMKHAGIEVACQVGCRVKG